MAIRTINHETCIGCGTCVESCPMDVFRLDVIAASSNERSPCSVACPLGVNQREYHNLIKLDMIDDAAGCLGSYHPMPVITGHICPHSCESECARKTFDQAININGIEQFLGKHLLEVGAAPCPHNGIKVAIIGSGPAGLSAAYFLRTKGYAVTVFDNEEKPGGQLRTTIPAFRLPVDVLDKQIAHYEKMGIEFQCKVTVGKDIAVDELKAQGYKACIATTGASKPFKLNVDGVNAEGITTAMDYLREVKNGTITKQDGIVAVMGGGSVALDSARSAVRLGAKEVHLVCLETTDLGHKDCMLAPRDEIEDALAEGVIIHSFRSTHHFDVQNGVVCGAQLVACTSVREVDGRFNPQYGSKIIESIPATTVVLAIGQGADTETVPTEFAVNQRGYIMADKVTNQVEDFLFGAGDCVTGPSTVVKALASGKRAAITVDNFLKGEDLATGLDGAYNTFAVDPELKIFQADRIDRALVPAEIAKSNFCVTAQDFSLNQAYMEAGRCLTCGSRSTISYVADCQSCTLCANYCPTNSIIVAPGNVPNILHAWDVNNLGK